MFTNPLDARDEMFALFAAGWEATDVLDTPPEIRWQGKEKGDIPPGYFVRVYTIGVKSEQRGFLQRDDPGASPPVFDTCGMIYASVFAPMSAEDSFRNGELLARAGRDIFRSAETPSGVWFRNARYVELPNDGKHYGWNVIVEYEFSET